MTGMSYAEKILLRRANIGDKKFPDLKNTHNGCWSPTLSVGISGLCVGSGNPLVRLFGVPRPFYLEAVKRVCIVKTFKE